MKIIVAAVPGAGKSSTLQLVKKRIPSAKIVSVGDLMFEVAKKKFKIKNRDEIRKKLSIEHMRYAQKIAYEKLAKMKDKIVLIDTHMSVKTPNGYFPGISDELAKLLKPDVIVVLEFDPKDVIERRKKDEKLKKIEPLEFGILRTPRERDIETEAEIEQHQQFNRQFAFTVGNVADAAVKVVDLRYEQKKPFEHAEKAAEEIIKLIQK
jgi:adenylate kinase